MIEPTTSVETKLIFQIENKDETVSFPECCVTLDNKQVRVFADSCSPYTLLEVNIFIELFPSRLSTLQVADIKPGGFNGDPIPLVDMTTMLFSFKGRNTVGKVYIAEKGSNLLGWKHQNELGIKLDPNSPDQVLLVDCSVCGQNICDEHPEVFTDNLGLLKDFQHHIKLKDRLKLWLIRSDPSHTSCKFPFKRS